jgi:hypothetical protein
VLGDSKTQLSFREQVDGIGRLRLPLREICLYSLTSSVRSYLVCFLHCVVCRHEVSGFSLSISDLAGVRNGLCCYRGFRVSFESAKLFDAGLDSHPVVHSLHRKCCVQEQITGKLERARNLCLVISHTLHHSYLFLIWHVDAVWRVE